LLQNFLSSSSSFSLVHPVREEEVCVSSPDGPGRPSSSLCPLLPPFVSSYLPFTRSTFLELSIHTFLAAQSNFSCYEQQIQLHYETSQHLLQPTGRALRNAGLLLEVFIKTFHQQVRGQRSQATDGKDPHREEVEEEQEEEEHVSSVQSGRSFSSTRL